MAPGPRAYGGILRPVFRTQSGHALCQHRGIRQSRHDDIYLWWDNGVSELIVMSMQAMPPIPADASVDSRPLTTRLWTAAVALFQRSPLHYHCDETEAEDFQTFDDIRRQNQPNAPGDCA